MGGGGVSSRACWLVAAYNEVSVIEEGVEEASGGQLGLQVGHQLQEPFTVAHCILRHFS